MMTKAENGMPHLISVALLATGAAMIGASFHSGLLTTGIYLVGCALLGRS